MPYNPKQYDAALNYLQGGNTNVVDTMDARRIQVYDLYENLYLNSSQNLKITLRGDDQYPILVPSGRKIIETTNRFLGIGFDYLVEPTGDTGTRTEVESYVKDWWKREQVGQKFASNKRWGLIRGDAVFYLYGDLAKDSGKRISIAEIDPRQLFLIEDEDNVGKLLGCHIVEEVQDFREKDKPNKKIARRRTFRKQRDEATNVFTGIITTELTYWEIGKWDDRQDDFDPKNRVRNAVLDEDEVELPEEISELPIYHWRNAPIFQNSSWGVSQLSGLETLFYSINQSLTDEDATIVFQGLGMYVTNAKPPLDPNTGEVTAWNVGPMQIIEIGADQKFERVTGITSVSPYQEHMNFINEKGLMEAAGTPATAIGRVDVATVASGIALKMELMPLLAANAEKELEFLTVLDQMLHDLGTMWLPAYEPELFGNFEAMADISIVSIFDDPMPVDRDAKIQETLLLRTSNLILTTMAIAKLRELGWEYPQQDENGNPLSDDDLAEQLSAQAKSDADNAAGSFGSDMGGGQTDQFGNPIEDPNALNGNEVPSEPQMIELGG